MTWYPQDSPPWRPPSQPHGLETERRLTTLELGHDRHRERLDTHDGRHSAQDVWNKAFTIAMLGLGSGLAHAKLPELIETARQLWRGFRP